jgi:hypothetical protein
MVVECFIYVCVYICMHACMCERERRERERRRITNSEVRFKPHICSLDKCSIHILGSGFHIINLDLCKIFFELLL